MPCPKPRRRRSHAKGTFCKSVAHGRAERPRAVYHIIFTYTYSQRMEPCEERTGVMNGHFLVSFQLEQDQSVQALITYAIGPWEPVHDVLWSR